MWFVPKKDKKIWEEGFVKQDFVKKLVRNYNIFTVVFLICVVVQVIFGFVGRDAMFGELWISLLDVCSILFLVLSVQAEGRVEGAFKQWKIMQNK